MLALCLQQLSNCAGGKLVQVGLCSVIALLDETTANSSSDIAPQ